MGDPFSGAAPSDVTLVLTTAPTLDVATSLAEQLLDAELIACANIVPGVRSLYRWKDGVQRDDEVIVLMKSTATTYARLIIVIQSGAVIFTRHSPVFGLTTSMQSGRSVAIMRISIISVKQN